MKTIKQIVFVLVIAAVMQACQPAGGEFPGSEYMPDMAHPISYEANAYDAYKYHTWDEQSVMTRKELTGRMHPVKGTIPRGYAGVYFASGDEAQQAVMDNMHGVGSNNAQAIPVNGKVPYYYGNTPEERLRATAEIIANPFPITKSGLESGKELYNIYCGLCHGEKGDGLGYLVRDADPAKGDPGGKYPAAPANLVNEDFSVASNGRFYHAIMYGLNVMGSYADKLSYEERWQVVHYIRSLQAVKNGAKYDESANTLNPAFGTPMKLVAKKVTAAAAPAPVTDSAAPAGPASH